MLGIGRSLWEKPSRTGVGGLSGRRMADATDKDRLAKALASFVRAEFVAPVHAVAGFCDLLIEDARRDGLERILEDLGTMKTASATLETLVDKLLDDKDAGLSLAGGAVEDVSAELRHELRTPITALLGYGELLSEEAREEGRLALVSTLDGLLDAARRLLGQIDALVDLLRLPDGPDGAQEEAAPDAPSLPDAVESIRAVLFDEPQPQPVVQGRILVVDDDVSNLDLLSRRLGRDGHEVSTCQTGQAALERVKERDFDLVLLDLIMPGVTGIDVLRALKAEPATRMLPVIMTSAMEEVDGAVRCIEAGADDFLAKPLDPVLLRARLNAALDRKLLRDREVATAERLRVERERSETLLRNVLPVPIVERLRRGETVIADHYDSVTILFCDLVGFTALAAQLRPGEILMLLNDIFSRFDALAGESGLEKIKTLGDGYMLAGGLPEPRPDHAAAVAAVALQMPDVVRAASRGQRLDLRVGLHTGPAVAGIIGAQKFAYDVWGDTVNTASRMERHGTPGRVHISGATRAALGDRYGYDSLPPMDIKGKGRMETFLIR